MPRKKVSEVSGNGGIKRKRGGGRKKEKEFSSEDDFDDFEQENAKKPGKQSGKSSLQPITVPDDIKEKINLWGPHRYGCLSEVQVSTVVSGPCSAHSLLITTEGKLWSWGR
ncbi:UNVERIFIED_CONTAM: hypothetical protein FKN15_005260 [Acipenser sinensis]